jgi:lipopolysaccharide/colanic/teichoic acid biosynthesis glycosyltransferase
MKASRSKRVIFLFSDIITLNISFLIIAFIKIFGFSFAAGNIKDVLYLVLWGNVYLTLPWVIIFLLFGFYRENWKFSFLNIVLVVSAGIFILKLVDTLHSLIKGSMSDIIPTPAGLKLIFIYWCLIMITLYASRFLLTAFFDYLDRKKGIIKESVISGAGYKDKSFGVSTDFGLVRHPLFYLVFKRIIDLIGGICALIIFLPTIVIVSIIIKITDRKGGIFFRQDRLGKHGKIFRVFKFRTMVHNAEEMLRENRELFEEYIRNNFKLPGDKDPRITRIGSFLRKTSLDELPQLFNVIAGDMSLIGPRPIVTDEIVKYDKYRKKHLSVKPGITGWWQVAGRSNIDYPDRIYLEMYYVERASVFFDLKILIETIPTVFFGKGAH